jgi:hypothetical protein
MSGLSPISFEFVAAGVARRARVALAHLVPSQVNKEVPSWKGHDGTIEGAEVATPITDRTFWESRYVLTELTLCKENGETLVVNDAVVTVTQEKHIVRTTLVDYDISISVGIVAVDSNGQIVDEYPKEGIRKIREFLDENKAVDVTSVFLSIFGIGRMVVTRFSLKQETASNRQTIEVRALSDEDYVIKSTEY